jgi:hypothetical protein
MPLKLKKSQTPSETPSAKENLSGSWGRINPEPQAVGALRICKKTSPSTEETHSYPYRVLSSWHWRGGIVEEELKIEASSDLVTIKGCGLDRLVEALDCNSLEVLRETPAANLSQQEGAIEVLSISITQVADAVKT